MPEPGGDSRLATDSLSLLAANRRHISKMNRKLWVIRMAVTQRAYTHRGQQWLRSTTNRSALNKTQTFHRSLAVLNVKHRVSVWIIDIEEAGVDHTLLANKGCQVLIVNGNNSRWHIQLEYNRPGGDHPLHTQAMIHSALDDLNARALKLRAFCVVNANLLWTPNAQIMHYSLPSASGSFGAVLSEERNSAHISK